MMKDEVLKRAIVACFPVEGPPGSFYIKEPGGYHFGRYDEALDAAVQKIFQLVREIEQVTYERGKRGEPL